MAPESDKSRADENGCLNVLGDVLELNAFPNLEPIDEVACCTCTGHPISTAHDNDLSITCRPEAMRV